MVRGFFEKDRLLISIVMTRYLFTFLLFTLSVVLHAQDRSVRSENFDESALFEGKLPEESFSQWICENFNYYDEYIHHQLGHGIECMIIVGFAVTEQGDVTDVKIVRTCDPLLDLELIHTVSSSPKWTPAKLNGIHVKTEHKFPLTFHCVRRYQSESFVMAKRFYIKHIVENTHLYKIEYENMFSYNIDFTKQIIISFVIDEKGNVSKIEMSNNIDNEFRKELTHIISLMPVWRDEITKKMRPKTKYSFTFNFLPKEKIAPH